jgi:pimeloyl-ACP methyl ester carboxylesterase
VFAHGSAGAGAQWRDIAALLPASARCLCPDLVGYGSGPAFDRGSYRFEQEIAIVEQALESAGASSILVGHSFGGVVALAAAIARPELVARLVLIEPVAFTLLDSTEHRASHQRLLAFCNRIDELVELGRMSDAAEAFFGFWELHGLWSALSDKRKKMIELVMPKLAAECALVHAPVFTASDITRRLGVPTLVLRGSESPRLEREVCAVVAGASPCCTLAELPGANHMSPVLRPQEVLAAIRDFSARPHAATMPTLVV